MFPTSNPKLGVRCIVQALRKCSGEEASIHRVLKEGLVRRRQGGVIAEGGHFSITRPFRFIDIRKEKLHAARVQTLYDNRSRRSGALQPPAASPGGGPNGKRIYPWGDFWAVLQILSSGGPWHFTRVLHHE